jgi:hypothetical protein
VAADRRSIFIAVIAIVLVVAGARDGTAIPGDKLLWLASAAVIISASGFELRRPRLQVSVGLALLLSSSFALADRQLKSGRDRRSALAEVTQFLARPGQDQWRFMTLGIGNERLELSRLVSVGTIDGGMPWLRAIPELADSRYYSLDDLPLDEPAAQAILRRVLGRADRLGLRWVVSVRPEADPLLTEAGYRAIGAFAGAVVLWAKDSVPAVNAAPATRSSWGVVWGCGPVALLALGLALLVGNEARARRRRTDAL